MATISFVLSKDPLSPAQLADQIATSLSLATLPAVDVRNSQIFVTHASVTETNRTTIQGLINAYVFDPAWAGGVETALRAKAVNALAANATFLAIASPTTAQVTTQAKALTRQVDALIRLVSGQTDSTSGT